MNGKNPYLVKNEGGARPPLPTRVPIHDFEDAHQMELELMPYELCVARIRNDKPTGFTHNVGLVYKDDMNRVYSLQFMQHHGELKDTPENRKVLEEQENGQTSKAKRTGKKNPARKPNKKSKKKSKT